VPDATDIVQILVREETPDLPVEDIRDAHVT